MNGLSIRELCCLFCCPPCPSRIAAKLAFLPPEPTYALLPDPDPSAGAGAASGPSSGAPLPSLGAPGLRSRLGAGSGGDRGGGGGTGGGGSGGSGAAGGCESRWKLHLTERAEFQYSQRELDVTDVFLTRSSRGNRVGCMYIRCAPNARFTVLFSHGNAVDLGQMSSFYIGLGTRINCNIFSYDYSGYGVSTGKPSEKNLYADIDAAWHALRSRYGISPENIILYGQSIGTVPTVDLASRFECAAVVLHSPLTSGMRVAFPDTKKTYCFDAFPNIEKVSKIPSPVLIIHGTEDEVIDFSHGLALFERCPKAVEPLWVEGAGHNDIELYSQYLERLRRFINQDLAAQHA
ncbi:alpha/beta hydrolase domain-containing protein 17A-like [Nerophis ophidion]|uniref:alpha/beta hydrolase domain-containing protein 17A-like n=1 Tax=Nerophis ophidion TaxID=159077 RepID=UPI002AE06598|nr:alpha/beta hydrolase domain-containing protein 17A-like [Nerophis ophidion]XP_061775728.1 alpha/beta hydrolase domain-containing protein 17A-like [Nerophis ophidion]XP_061775731.1 alpha/beta hydrolase domain-containing protein 17A-like [Nerophis ophidion]XP_061775732.1 alpha/beta hydrolase domain-containing protein 17A-like [Nerophis ophidion]